MGPNASDLVRDAMTAVCRLDLFVSRHRPDLQGDSFAAALVAYRSVQSLAALLSSCQEGQADEASVQCVAFDAPEVVQEARQPPIPEAS